MKYIALLLTLICLNAPLQAEVLKFKCGDSAKCRITENYENESVIVGHRKEMQAEWTIEMMIKILGVDENELPILIEITPLKMDFNVVEKKDGKITLKKYNSRDSFLDVSEFEPFKNLISQHLVFFVRADQSTVEATGVLAEFKDKIDFVIFDFEDIASRLLHLSGEELSEGSSHIIKADTDNDSVYTIHTVNSGLIGASWQSDLQKVDEFFSSQSSVDGSVVWNMNNPLIQKRELHSKFSVKFYDDDGVRMSAHQTWEPIE